MYKLTKDFTKLLAQFLKHMGQADAISSMTVTVTDDQQETVHLTSLGAGVDVGWLIDVNTILGIMHVPGYRVYVMKIHRGGRWNPDEEEDVTVGEYRTAVDACAALGAIIAQEAAYRAAEAVARVEEPQEF